MVSRRIDLTEHGDFRGDDFMLVEDFDVDVDVDVYDFDTIEKNKFFGEYRHKNEKWSVFGFENKWRIKEVEECWRCGAPIKLPWKRFHNLCELCDKILEDGRQIPWKEHPLITTNSNPNTKDLFNLR